MKKYTAVLVLSSSVKVDSFEKLFYAKNKLEAYRKAKQFCEENKSKNKEIFLGIMMIEEEE